MDIDSDIVKKLDIDLEHLIDACNRLRNTASTCFLIGFGNENIKATNNLTEVELANRAKYLDNLGNIGACAKTIRDLPYTKSIRTSIKEIQEHLSVTAK